MENNKMEELTKDIEELKLLEEKACRQRSKNLLLIERRKLETELINLRETSIAAESKTKTTVPPTNRRTRIDLKEYAWDQSDKFTKIFISIDGVHKLPEDSVIVNFTEKSMNLLVTDLNNKDYTFVVNNLLEAIDVEKSYRKVKTDMIAIYMKKVKEGSKWSYMTQTEKRLKDSKMADTSDALADNKDDPSAGLMNVIKKMYDSGDDEMKRMINKAWHEGQTKRGGPGDDKFNF
uniref:Calcyclin-binding protein n=1 Tax=Corethrella appendiculata TaxID=1370023 RepID=U5ENM9_9DIPT